MKKREFIENASDVLVNKFNDILEFMEEVIGDDMRMMSLHDCYEMTTLYKKDIIVKALTKLKKENK